VPEINIVTDQQPQDDSQQQTSVQLQVELDFPGNVYFRGRGLLCELGGNLTVSGPLQAPVVTGSLSVLQGSYSFMDTQFTVNEGRLDLFGQDLEVRLKASASQKELLVHLEVYANGSDVDVQLSSDPSLPEDEILSQLLFGADLGSLSPMQAARLAMAIKQLQGGKRGFDPIGSSRRLLGLQELDVTTTADGSARIHAGRYITKGVFIGVDKQLDSREIEAEIRVDLTEEISLEAKKTAEDEANSLGLFWTHEY
jgi:translocation and assembly module TamB